MANEKKATITEVAQDFDVKITRKSGFTASAITADGVTIHFSRSNSSWHDYEIGNKKVGDKLTVPIKMSNKGNAMIDYVGAEKYVSAINIENAISYGKQLQKKALAL